MKKRLIKIIISLIIFTIAFFVKNDIIKACLYTASYIIIGYSVIIKAGRNISYGKVFDENFLMVLATFGAFAVKELPEACAVMIFYQIGSLFESYAVSKSRKSISTLMDIRPDYANLIKDGNTQTVDPSTVSINDLILVRAGEKIPLDGIVENGTSALDVSALTGESLPYDVCVGSEVMSGSVNKSGVLEIRVTKEFHDSTVSKILDLVENAASKKSKSENFITRFAQYYTPSVVGAAVLLALIPPLFFSQPWTTWIYRALNFLVVSCPCALVISVPLSFFGGIGGASKKGVLVKGSNYLEAIADADTVVFDKTGTLTQGRFEISKLFPIGISEEDLLYLAAYAEYHSNHPLSVSVKNAYNKEINEELILECKELPGLGMFTVADNHEIYAGNAKLMKQQGYDTPEVGSTVIHIASDGKYCGYIELEDKIKPNTKEAILSLKKYGVQNLVMLTGDNERTAQNIASKLGITKVFANLFPDDKVRRIEEMLKNQRPGTKLVFVGDGINDAPVLSIADVGIAMGQIGSDAAIEASDIVIMTDDLLKIVDTIKISKKTLAIVRQNIVFALSIKLIVLILSALGITGMWAAVFADVGVSVIAILNAMRCL